MPDQSTCWRIVSRSPNAKLDVYHSTWHWPSEIEAHIFLRDAAALTHPHQTHRVEPCPEHTIWICQTCTEHDPDAEGPHQCETIMALTPDSRYCECECWAKTKIALQKSAPRRPCAFHPDHSYMLCIECTRRNTTHHYCIRNTPIPHANDRMRRSYRKNGW